MKAAVIHQYGSKDQFKIADLPQPQPRSNEVLVRVHAASVNPIDWRIRIGQFRLFVRRKFPLVLGSDISGVIVKVGEKVENLKENDEVFAMLRPLENGAYSEYVAVPAADVALKPKNLSFEEAAAIPLACLTALNALRDFGKINSSSKVLINGATGGVGTFAVQIAKAYGAQVTGVCGTQSCELAKRLGAQETIDYNKEDFTKVTNNYDIVFDAIGNSSYLQCRRILSPKGIYITTLPSVTNALMYLLTRIGKGKKAEMILVKPSGKDLEDIKRLIEQGKLKPVIDKVYPLEEIANAHQHSEGHHAKGKIVIKIS